MDKLDKCYIWHVVTMAKLKLRLKELKKGVKEYVWKKDTFKGSHRNKIKTNC